MVSKNEYTTSEDKNKQIHSQIKVHNEHLKNIIEIDKYKKKKRKRNWPVVLRWDTKQNTTTV